MSVPTRVFHPARRHMYRIIADIIGDIAKMEDLSGSVRMRRDDGEDDVLLFVKSQTRRPLGSPRLRGRRSRSIKSQTRSLSDFFPPARLWIVVTPFCISFFSHSISLHIDMKMILSLKCSGSHCSSVIRLWIFLGIFSTRTPSAFRRFASYPWSDWFPNTKNKCSSRSR